MTFTCTDIHNAEANDQQNSKLCNWYTKFLSHLYTTTNTVLVLIAIGTRGQSWRRVKTTNACSPSRTLRRQLSHFCSKEK